MGRNGVLYVKSTYNIVEGYITGRIYPVSDLPCKRLKKGMPMVYVISKNGQPLMPTHRHGKVRRLLKEGKANVIKKTPFTIQLLFETTNYVDHLTLGVDAGSKVIGLSVSSVSKEVYASEVTLRHDIVDLLATKRQNRRTRRNRLRYRQPRFNNRTRSKHKGWLAPSIEHKIQNHLKVVEEITKILPISKIVVETASLKSYNRRYWLSTRQSIRLLEYKRICHI